MPRIIASSPSDRLKPYKQYIEQLVQELKGEGTAHQPLIYERASGPMKTKHVIVFWDEWESVPQSVRGAIILRAYELAEPKVVSEITLAMGVTYAQAVELNLLPYQVQPMLRESDALSRGDALEMMRQEGAIQYPNGAVELRFPTAQMAEAAHDRLAKKSSSEFWAIVSVVSSIRND